MRVLLSQWLTFIRLSIRRRLVAYSLLVVLAFVGVTLFLVSHVVRIEIGELMDQELHEAGQVLHTVLSHSPREHMNTNTTPGSREYEDYFVWQVVNIHTRKVEGYSHRAPVDALLLNYTPEPRNSADGQWRLVSFRFRQYPELLLVVGQRDDERREASHILVWQIGMAASVLAVLMLVLLYGLIGRELRPLRRFSEQVRRYDPMKPETVPALSGRLELDVIERAVIDLGQRLGQRIVTERAFTTHAAHALRTPVAGMDVQLAMAIREAPETLHPRLKRARLATQRLGRVMQALLTMFRSGIEPNRQQVQLAELIRPMSFEGLDIRIDDDGSLYADADLLSALLFNLLDNAQRHLATQVQIRVARYGAEVRLSVTDDGEGCSPERLAELCQALAEQNYGADSGLKGLGLILADLVVRAHGGRLELLALASGFRVDLIWPSH